MGASFIETLFNLIFLVSFVVVIFYLLTRVHLFINAILAEVKSKKGIIALVLVGSILEIIASEFGIPFPEGVMADIRMPIAFVFGMMGGAAVGIPVGVVGGAYRMSGLLWSGFRGTLGYTFAVAGGLATIGAGIVGSFLYHKGINISEFQSKKRWYTILFFGCWILVDIEIICPLTAPFFSEMSFLESFYISNATILLPIFISDIFALIVFISFLRSIIMDEKKKRVLQKLVKRYEALIGPVAGRIAKDTAKEESYPIEDLKLKEK